MKKYLLLIGVFLMAGLTANAQVNVTFTADMSVWAQNGYFNPSTDTVRLAGDFNGWSTTATSLTAGSGVDSSKYSVQVAGVSSGEHQYKFLYTSSSGLQWENDPNRISSIGSSDTTLPAVFFNGISGKSNHVIFSVDMSLPIKQGNVTPGVTNVYLAGDMTDWQNSALPMTQGTSDSVYSVIVDSLTSGSTHSFKFVYSSGAAADGTWEDDPNRTYLVPEQDSSTFFDYWNRTNPNIQTGNGQINFAADLSVMTEIGIFDPATDSVQIRGGFNGWTDADPSKSNMAQNPINDSSYFISISFTNEPLGNKPYKYFVKIVNPTGVDTLWKDGYERPVNRGGDNRQVFFAGDANKDSADYYDGVKPDWVIPSGTNLQVKFSVDMNPAMDGLQQAIPFDPAQDTLFWINEQPAFTRSQEWVDVNEMRVLKLEDQGGGIYSGTLTLKEPTFNAFEYRYAWHKGSDATWVFEPEALGTFDTYRVRFVGQDAARSFPVNPWEMPMDTWTNNAVKTDQETDPYSSLTGLTNENIKPSTYSLSQNYPNPFNPSTTIKFSIQKPGLVTLKIYNLLGQEVTTLINRELTSGSYSYEFDASYLSSGVYFYSINAGSFVQTKKMMLLK